MKKILTGLVLFILTVCGAQEVIPPYKGGAPNACPLPAKRAFSRPETGRPTVRTATRPGLAVFLPEHQNASRTAVVVHPGPDKPGKMQEALYKEGRPHMQPEGCQIRKPGMLPYLRR